MAAVLLGGCAQPPQWEKQGSSAESAAADAQACRLAAPRAPHVPAPRTKVGMGGGLDSAFEQEANRVRDEERHVAECMRAKGYRDAR